MRRRIKDILRDSISVKERILENQIDTILEIVKVIISSFRRGGKLLFFGNGGSASDCQHLAAEFVGRFQKERKALPAISLTTDTPIITSLSNDYNFEIIFSRQIEALGKKGDVVVGITTSGRSKNVILGLKKAKEMGLKTIVLTGERDCSLQRKHQKLLEETPSPVVDMKLRKRLGDLAVRGAKGINYTSLGTIEFLLDREQNFYFMEVNTRVQVEHPITEMITGIDLIKEQIRIASGERLRYSQDDIRICGSAIECRINAEDPNDNFIPSPGKIESLNLPGGRGVRVDTHIFEGYSIPPFYDSLIAKLITYGKDRDEAIQMMKRSLDEFIVEPIKTTVSLHKRILEDPRFLRGEFYTDFVDEFLKERMGVAV